MSDSQFVATEQPLPRALIFDMDGLLIDSEPVAARALAAFIESHGRAVRPGTMELTLGRRLPEAVAMIADAYGLVEDVAVLTDRYDRLRLAALRGNLRQMAGANDLLEFARAAGLRVGLATSSQRTHADLSLAETGLTGRFDAEATGDEVERGKPAPDLFLLVAGRLGEAPAACVVIEDAPAGLAAAAAAGMRRLWVPNDLTRGLTPPVAIDGAFADLKAVIPWLQAYGVA
jgi:HAD superfamily hydrolase (TIGR01509 family)